MNILLQVAKRWHGDFLYGGKSDNEILTQKIIIKCPRGSFQKDTHGGIFTKKNSKDAHGGEMILKLENIRDQTKMKKRLWESQQFSLISTTDIQTESS